MAYVNRQWRKWMAVGCSHGSLIDPVAAETAILFAERWKPERRLHLGDVFDETAFRTGAKNTPDETASISDDLTAGLDFLECYRPTDILNGNHDDRVWKLAYHYNAIIAHAACSVINEFVSVAQKIGARHITHYDIRRSWIELGGTKFLHGFMYGEQALRDHAEHFGNCVIAHLHRPGMAPGRRADSPRAYCVSTLADIARLEYAKGRRATSMWAHGLAYGEYCEDECKVWIAQDDMNGNWNLPL